MRFVKGIVPLLLLSFFLLTACSESDSTSSNLLKAVDSGDLEKVRQILKKKPDPDKRDSTGGTALHASMFQDNVAIIELLIEHGYSINARSTHNNFTPLHDAVWTNNLTAIEILVEHGADLTLKDSDGMTPLDKAKKEGRSEIVDYLAKKMGLVTEEEVPLRKKRAEEEKAGTVEITFHFQRLLGGANNQFGIWIEDANGKFVRNVFVTSFSAEGGWKYRADSLPQWVKSANAERYEKGQVDVFSGATPPTGEFACYWELNDENGNRVPDGKYRLIFEGVYRSKDSVLYSADIDVGGKKMQDINFKTEYFGRNSEDRLMIRDVEIKYYPSK